MSAIAKSPSRIREFISFKPVSFSSGSPIFNSAILFLISEEDRSFLKYFSYFSSQGSFLKA
jgi:hypothetical protein